jgi:lambda family phage portal protein
MAKKTLSQKYKNFARSFDAGRFGRLEDLNETRNINFDINSSISTIRARCRALAQNDPHVTKALSLLRNNIIGNTGIDLHCQARKQDSTLDEKLNLMVEDAWWEFGRYGISTTCGTMTFLELQKLIIESIARDGEFFAIKRYGSQFGKFGFQLDLIPIELLSHSFSGYADNGNVIFQSIEYDRFLKPRAYWVSDEMTNQTVNSFTQNYKQPSIRIPADDCIHLFEKHYVGQSRGFSWLVSAVLPIHHLNSYRISELEQARIASLKQLFFTLQPGVEGMSQEDIDASGRISQKLEPGGVDILPQGVTPQVIDFATPNSAMPDFLKAQLKAVSSGLCLSYSSIANDLESINFSSAKYSFAEDVTTFQNKQQWFIDHFLNRVYEDWLKYQVDSGRLAIPATKYSKCLSPKWTPRGFRSVNLTETAKAATMLYQLGLASLTQLSSEFLGLDWEETITQIASEQQKMETLDVELPALVDILKLEALESSQIESSKDA